jgi:hypothetical protein
MSNTIRSLIIKVGADLSEAQKGLKELSKSMKTASRELTATGKALTNSITIPVIAAGIASVKLASDYQESLNKVNVAFGDNARQITEWANTTLKQFGIASGTALDLAANYGDMATAMGATTNQAADMGKQIVGRAADLASFKNISIDVANTALTSIFTGETESLKKLGVVMTEANLKTYMLTKGYQQEYKDLTQLQKVQLRYEYVMEMTNNAAGDFARTQGGVANQSRIFIESLKELGISFGNILLPSITNGIKALNNLIGKLTNLNDGTKQTIIYIAGLAAAMGPAMILAGKLTEGFGKLALGLSKAGTALKGGEGLTGAITSFLGPGGQAKLIIVAIVVALGALTIAFREASREEREFKQEAEGIVDAYNAVKEANKTQMTEMQTNTDLTAELTTELYELNKNESKSVIEKTRMANIVKQLNLMYDGLNLAIDETTGLLNREESAIQDIISARQKQMEYEAYTQALADYQTERIKLENEQARAIEKIAEAYGIEASAINDVFVAGQLIEGAPRWTGKTELLQAYNELRIALADNMTSYNETATTWNEMTVSMSNDSKTLVNNMTYTQDQMQTMVDAIILGSGELTEEAKLSQDAFNQVATANYESLNLSQEQLNTLFALYDTTYDTAQKDYETYIADLEAATERHYNSMGGLFEKVPEAAKVSKDELLKILEEQIKAFSGWDTDLQEIATRVGADGKLIVDEGLIKELRELGPKAAGEVSTMSTMTDEELIKYVDLWREKNKLAKEAAIEELGGVTGEVASIVGDVNLEIQKTEEIKNSAVKLGETITTGLQTGIENKASSLIATARSVARRALNAMKQEIQPGSPSKITTAWGRAISEGLTAGIGQKAHEAINSAASLAFETMSSFNNIGLEQPALASGDYSYMNVLPENNLNYAANKNTETGKQLNLTMNINREIDPYGVVRAVQKMDKILSR